MNIKSFKKLGLFALLTVVLGVGIAYAATRSSSKYSAANAVTTLVTNGCQTIDITINNTNAALASTVTFFDAPVGSISNIIPSYTNIVSTVGLVTNVWTNYYGVLNSNVFYAITETPTLVPQTTNFYPVVYSAVFGSNSTTKITIAARFVNGMVITNNASVSAIVNYNQ